LKALFPDLVTEGPNGPSVNVDVLKALVGDATLTDAEEKYGLNWHGKRAARQLALTPSIGTLRPCPDESVDWDTTKNLMIEGDNLEVLKLLQKSYANKVKIIYIDPPYNTGKDFVYPDDFRDNVRNYLELTGQAEGGRKVSTNTEISGRFHTDWLNMMLPRLRLARSLLRDDGVIFVSIDDNESANLKLLLSEVFGEENFIDTVAVEMSTTSGPKTVNAQQGTIVKNVEFVHIYRKSPQFDQAPHTPLFDGIDSFDTHYTAWLNDDGTIGTLAKAMLADLQVRLDVERYGFLDGGEFSVGNLSKLMSLSEPTRQFIESNVDRIARVDRPPVSASGQSTAVGHWKPFEVEHRTYYLTTLANGTLQALMPLSLNFRMSDDYKPRYGRTVIRGDLWKGFHADMGNVAKEGGIPYSNGKKPVRLIKQLIKWAGASDGEIIMDFFAGSGTTGHAVMQLNSEDSRSRRFILVQLPEPLDKDATEQKAAAELCEQLSKPPFITELTKERLRRSAAKISLENPAATGDFGFRVLKLDRSNFRAWNPGTSIATSLFDHVENVKEGRTEGDLLAELFLKFGLDLCVATAERAIGRNKVTAVGQGALVACLDARIDASDVEPLAFGIIGWLEELEPAGDVLCVFRDGAFIDDVSKANMAAVLQQGGVSKVRSL